MKMLPLAKHDNGHHTPWMEAAAHAAMGIPSLCRYVRHAFERQAQRRALAKLDSRRLDDIGITREAAKREIARRFWQE